MSAARNRIRWEHVEKWYKRDGLRTNWKPWGMPSIVDPHGSAFADIDPMPRWRIEGEVAVSVTMNGAFFSRQANPAIPVTPDEIIQAAETAIAAGAQIIHLHVRDDHGYNVLDVDRFRRVIEPLRERHPHIAVDGCLVATNCDESVAMEQMFRCGLLDTVPINTTAVLLADNMFLKSPHAIIKKTKLALDAGIRPQIAVYSDGDVDNARRFLVDSGLLEPPFFWLVLPGLPGCSPMYSPDSMISGLTRFVGLIREVCPDPIISVCAAGRASTYLATLSMILGLHVRVGMEDTVYKWPHRDDLLDSNAGHFRMITRIAQDLGRPLMSAADYLKMVGAAPRQTPGSGT